MYRSHPKGGFGDGFELLSHKTFDRMTVFGANLLVTNSEPVLSMCGGINELILIKDDLKRQMLQIN